MPPTLIFIGGPPGVGKTAVARELTRGLTDSVWLEGDDLWRMHPFIVDERTTAMVERNIGWVLGSFLDSGFSRVILSWVLHRDDIVHSLLSHVRDREYAFHHFTLVSEASTLRARLAADKARTTDPELALRRLAQAERVTSELIDTTNKSPEQVAEALLFRLTR